jgi:hypothetical protein
MRLRHAATGLTVALAGLIASPAQAAWQPEQQVNDDDATVTDIAGARVGTADDGTATAVWLEWRGTDARVSASRRPPGGDWGTPQPVADLTENPNAASGGVALDDMNVLPDGTALISYQEYEAEAPYDFVSHVVKLRPDGSISEPLLSTYQGKWLLTADADGDWLATVPGTERCSCANDTYYFSGGTRKYLGAPRGFGLRFALGRGDLVFYAVDDPDGLFDLDHTLRVMRFDASGGSDGTAKLVALMRPAGKVTGFDLDANTRGDVALTWSVRREERGEPDTVRVLRHRAGGQWGSPQTLADSSGSGNKRIGAPQVEMTGDGGALLAWSSPRDDRGRVDLDSTALEPAGPPTPVQQLARNIRPDSRMLRWHMLVNDSGRAALAFRHTAPCMTEAVATSCDTVSAVRGVVGRRYGHPVVLFDSATPYETVRLALSETGVSIVLTVVDGTTLIRTRALG